MASIFGNPKGRDENDPQRKLQAEIESIEYRKQAFVTALQNEIHAERQKIDAEYYQMGVDVYENHDNLQEISGKLSAHIDAIESYIKIIAEKEEKIMEISMRYDEEAGMLRSHLNMTQAQAPQQYNAPSQQYSSPVAQGDGARCRNCGNPYTPGVNIFCENCGVNLGAPAANINQAPTCTSCGAVYTPGRDAFCQKCGQRL